MEKNTFGTGAYESTSSLFRNLTAEEVKEFRAHARENYVVGTEINEVHHPVYQYECMQMNADAKNVIVNEWKVDAVNP
ncbi:MAG: hypothetical protein HN745_10100 [Deltaproteobacteria bacterium]|jgi:hypothetical protein|nr:hypothetical protein [Deltaproteobacteria bacterium]MBT7712065.1 hypothetical protein [Deltaproteobacteria bacterium]